MSRRYLFGPVPAAFADQNLKKQRQAGDCLTFNHEGTADLKIEATDTWETVCSHFPSGWQPDFITLYLPYRTIPACLWAAPVPLVCLAGDWNLLWHYYRQRLRSCELVLTDTVGMEVLAKEGITHARAANIYGYERAFLKIDAQDAPRDIDILFVGNLNRAVQRERLPWLGRLARLGQRWHVVIGTNVYGDDYRQLLRRARVAFNRGIRQECNQRAFEATAAGALLFQEAENRETPLYFRDRQECVYYTADNLEELLEHYLAHEDERRTIAEAARVRVQEYSFEKLWDHHLELIESEWPALVERVGRRPLPSGTDELLTRTWQLLGTSSGMDPNLFQDLTATVEAQPRTAALHNALGIAISWVEQRSGPANATISREVESYFQRACDCDPTDAVVGLNLAEAEAASQQKSRAIEQARRTLAILDRQKELSPLHLDAAHFPPAFDVFRVEWERAAWANAGNHTGEVQAKRDLLRWRLQALLAELTGEQTHVNEAIFARPDLPTTQAALGRSLVRAHKPAEAVAHLRQALAADPFDRDAARALYQVLGQIGNGAEQCLLARECWLLARAAPQVVPVEEWFAESMPDRRPAPGPRKAFTIVWEGHQAVLHSYALVNREFCLKLIERGHEVAIIPSDPREGAVPVPTPISERFHKPLTRPIDVHVRNQWPPDFTPPKEGHWVMIQPWEFGSLPRAWVGPMTQLVDEIWVPSRYVRECYLQSGVPAERVQIVPLGVAPAFQPEAPPMPLKTRKRFKFLFVGGTIHRKGIDVLLAAYNRTFTDADDVCLVIKDMGSGSFYQGQTAEQLVRQSQAETGAPEIEYLDRELEELASLYTACNCLAHPYRGEGFGLPIAEAMACGLPVIVTGHGAALDFCNEDNAFLLPARVTYFSKKQIGDLETVALPWLAEPDLPMLQHYLRYVVDHPEEARRKGQLASRHIRSHFTWDHADDVVEARLQELLRKPIRRLQTQGTDSGSPAVSAATIQQVQPTAIVEAGKGQAVPPAGNELTSIIVLCCNQLNYTRLCLESVFRFTRPPYELVLVDNGSKDGTLAYLESVRRQPGPVRVKVIRNETNRGFAAGCNQGIRQARGRYLTFLNNDTVVTEGWLDCLIKCVLHQWPHVGMVGPVTNQTAAPQQIEVDYTDLAGMPAFGLRRRQEFRGRAAQVERLTGFCLLARKEVIDRVGGFDERFGLGFYDDEDLSFRVRDAGFRLLVAMDVFVHHFGGRTFTGLGLDQRRQHHANFEQFQAKWGADRTVIYRPADYGVPKEAASRKDAATDSTLVRKQRVSLCMIVKNEEDTLAACLESAAGLAVETIVLDTGSTDRTREIAARLGARVVDFTWVDDFSAARNESIRHATGDWIFWLDADERLDTANRDKLRKLFAGLKDEKAAYVMKQWSVSPRELASAVAVDQVRLFRNDPALRWQYRVHEQILLSIRQAGHDVRWTDVVIGHVGYQEPKLSRNKLERNVRLLHRQETEDPDDPVTLYHLGLVYQQMGKIPEALSFLRRCLDRTPADYSIRPKAFSVMGRGHLGLGQAAEALAVCRQGRGQYPQDVELLFLEGLLLREKGDLAGAEKNFRQLLQLPPSVSFASVDVGLRSYKARHQLGQIYLQQQRWQESENELRQAVTERPDFLFAWQDLGELYLKQQRWPELDKVIAHLEGPRKLEAMVLRAQGHLIRKEFAQARPLLEAAVAQAPQAVWFRILLSRAILQEGRDWQRAEQVLRSILVLHPGQKDALGKLSALLRQQGRATDNAATDFLTLEELYQSACTIPSDIHEHCPVLYALAKECQHVTEMGTRTGVSTAALLHAQPARLVCYNRILTPHVARLLALAGHTEMVFHQADVREVEIEETDLLLLDTWHVYEQLKEELRLHAGKVRKIIAIHDTTTFGEEGETEGHRGLWPAVEEFLALGAFRLKQRYENNNGVTVLEKK